jgi:hypothetical protein
LALCSGDDGLDLLHVVLLRVDLLVVRQSVRIRG